MEERTMQRSDRQMQRKAQRKQNKRNQHIGGAILVLFLAIMLIGFSRGMPSKGMLANSSATNNPFGNYADQSIAEGALSAGQPQNAATEEINGRPWYLTLVNRYNPIPDHYDVNLVEIAGGEQVDERIYEPLMEMLEAAKEGNWNQLPLVVSGYRTKEKQQQLYDDKVAKYRKEGYSESEAKDLAQQWVSIPGYSEHHLGFAVDINGATYDVYLWLQENSYKYGFIFRYPGNKTEITNAAEEVWHYRYVGVEAATQMYEQGLCLEEYLERLERGI